MKKIFSLILALALVMSMSVTAFAETVEDKSEGTQEIPISATYKSSSETPDIIYNADIEWSGVNSFTYSNTVTKTWQPGSHSYSETPAGSWTGSATFTVKNHSNGKLKVDFVFAPVTGITGDLTVDSQTLDAATEGSEQSEAPSVSSVLTITDGEIEASGDIGKVTITLTGAGA